MAKCAIPVEYIYKGKPLYIFSFLLQENSAELERLRTDNQKRVKEMENLIVQVNCHSANLSFQIKHEYSGMRILADPLIFWPAGSVTFSSDPDPTCDNGYIKLFSSRKKNNQQIQAENNCLQNRILCLPT